MYLHISASLLPLAPVYVERCPNMAPKGRGGEILSFSTFLDMKMIWLADGDLWFGVYLKPGQELKYLNSDSSRPPPHCFKAITKGIFRHLASCTLMTEESRYMSIEDIYPRQHQALDSAGLLPKYIPTLQKC
jgi:hypothetical protein